MPELIEAIRNRNLRSVSAVFDYLAGGQEDAGSKPGLASLLSKMLRSSICPPEGPCAFY